MLVENETRFDSASSKLGRRIGKGALIAALVGTLVVPATSAQAVPCPATGSAQLTQGDISIEVRRLQTNLMVAALSCGARADYNDFILTHRPSLQKYGKAIRAEFRRRYGKSGAKQLNRFITRLANEASAQSNADRDAFCANASALFTKANAQGMTVSRMVTVPANGAQLASAAACNGTTAGYQSVSTETKNQ
jgi:hypothetical protein